MAMPWNKILYALGRAVKDPRNSQSGKRFINKSIKPEDKTKTEFVIGKLDADENATEAKFATDENPRRDFEEEYTSISDADEDSRLRDNMNARIKRESESIAGDKFREDAKDAELSDEFDDELLGQEREDEVIRIGEEIVNELKKRGSAEDFDDIIESIRMRYKK